MIASRVISVNVTRFASAGGIPRSVATWNAMAAGDALIARGILRDPQARTYGPVDLLVRSDVLQELFPAAFEGEEERLAAVWSSLDNVTAFALTRPSLERLLARSGFTSVYECHVPAEPAKEVHVPAVPADAPSSHNNLLPLPLPDGRAPFGVELQPDLTGPPERPRFATVPH